MPTGWTTLQLNKEPSPVNKFWALFSQCPTFREGNQSTQSSPDRLPQPDFSVDCSGSYFRTLIWSCLGLLKRVLHLNLWPATDLKVNSLSTAIAGILKRIVTPPYQGYFSPRCWDLPLRLLFWCCCCASLQRSCQGDYFRSCHIGQFTKQCKTLVWLRIDKTLKITRQDL